MRNMTESIREEIKKSNLQYLWGQEGKEFTLTADCESTTHGAVLRDRKGEDPQFIPCLLGQKVLPKGTKGLLFTSEKIHYSDWVSIGDMDLPKVGATITKTGAYYTFCTITELEGGHEVLTSCFKSVDHAPKVIGKVK